jgi:hypothetical protein
MKIIVQGKRKIRNQSLAGDNRFIQLLMKFKNLIESRQLWFLNFFNLKLVISKKANQKLRKSFSSKQVVEDNENE